VLDLLSLYEDMLYLYTKRNATVIRQFATGYELTRGLNNINLNLSCTDTDTVSSTIWVSLAEYIIFLKAYVGHNRYLISNIIRVHIWTKMEYLCNLDFDHKTENNLQAKKPYVVHWYTHL
jgi:hypothetical protein